VAHWSDAEVARRWLLLFPKRVNDDGSPAEPLRAEIDEIVNDPDKVSNRRRRLSDISWLARCTAENIARLSNREDNVTGHFWEGRYKSQLLLDERADPIGHDASEKGFLSIALGAYLELLDWTGRQLRSDKRGSIPEHLSPILTRLGLNTSLWCEVVREFGRIFKQAVGTATSLSEEAARRGQRWPQSPGSLA
jgi:hypothetical protein